MRRWIQIPQKAAVVFALAAMACADHPSAPETHDLGTGSLVQSVSGIYVGEVEMRRLLADLTQNVALALDDPDVRMDVYRALQASPFREGKLHFATFTRGRGASLLARMAQVRSVPVSRIVARLDSIIDLEFYMPVPAHRARWIGGADLIVASTLADDETVPVAYGLSGDEVRLSSPEVPPTTPTLVLVPVETDFSRPPAFREAAIVAEEQPGVYMTRSEIWDDHEGWLMGEPEFEVHVFVQNQYGTFVDVQCAGQYRTGALYYDQNSEVWYGRAMLVLGVGIEGDSVQLHMWEDDTGACTDLGGRPPTTTSVKASQIAGWAARGVGIKFTPNKTLKAFQGAALLIDLLTGGIPHHDDFVGFMMLDGPSPGCWPATGPARHSINNLDGGIAGTANIDWTFGERDPLCPPGPPPSYTATLSGPWDVQPYASCSWGVSTNLPSPPYTHVWTVDGVHEGDDAPSLLYTAGSTSFELAVSITNSVGQWAWGVRTITVDAGAAECIDM